MLPQVTPRMAGCDTATRYLPGTLLGRVGGDWFDSIKLPGSRTALVVGDVMGHGLNSAAMMGQLRTAVQTMAALDLPPDQLLRNLDDLAQRLGEHYLATCLYAVYDPIRGELLMANAGHVPPVIVRSADGRSELLELPTGAPIGVGGVPFETARIRVEPGDRLVMCTDGLVEVRGEDIGVGLATLCEYAAHPAASMDDACDTIIRALNTRGGRKDDVALLMARLNGITRERRRRVAARRRPARGGPGPPPGPRTARALEPVGRRGYGRAAGQRGRHQRHPARARPPGRAAPGAGRGAPVRGGRRRPHPADTAQRGPARRGRAVACAWSARSPASGAPAAPATARPSGSTWRCPARDAARADRAAPPRLPPPVERQVKVCAGFLSGAYPAR